jgi:LPXTG-motif cell wall-anchored protein
VLVHVVASSLAALVLVIGASPARADDLRCEPPEHQYRCGAILVILTEDTSDEIGDVIARLGGNPDTDVLQEFTAVRDILDPTGVAKDTSSATVYQIKVPVGTEQQAAAQYSADPAVYAAAVDRETIGTLTPNGAMPLPRQSPTNAAIVVIGMALLGLAGVLARRKTHSTAQARDG